MESNYTMNQILFMKEKEYFPKDFNNKNDSHLKKNSETKYGYAIIKEYLDSNKNNPNNSINITINNYQNNQNNLLFNQNNANASNSNSANAQMNRFINNQSNSNFKNNNQNNNINFSIYK